MLIPPLALTTALIQIGLICVGSSYMALTIPFTLILVYWIQKFYLRTSRQMRLLDLESYSPLYQHFTETIEGAMTIRAFGWQQYFNSTALPLIDNTSNPYYLLCCIQRWLSTVLDMTASGMGVLVVALAVYMPDATTGGSLGIALTSILGFNGTLQNVIEMFTQSEMLLGAVSRTRQFERDTPSEKNAIEELDPGESWPLGQVQVTDLSVTYKDGTVGLKSASFHVTRGQKLGIAGRTGSGKSTLLSCLLRLIDPTRGSIIIDERNIGDIPKNLVRERLICVPQDALLFVGTFQFNLDPQGHVSDNEVVIDVLKLVGLWSLVESRGGLSGALQPDTLSHGEQQLLAVARAVLRKRAANGRCILILDEATSNIDGATQAVVQKVIDTEFKENTVITVAHRLETIKDCDVVIVLENGEISKIGPPSEVL
jgi:ATP-binding cassette, subfamily C (CFTR/MRP), member 1